MGTTAPSNFRQLSRFFIPLAIQAASQALSYPLVAMVASRGPGGPVNLAGLAQSNTVMFFLGMFAIYFVTTGMVFAKSREGYQKFKTVVRLTGLGDIAVQAALCIPTISHLLFAKIIGLPPSIEQPAQTTLLACIPLQFLFFSRIPYFVLMYNGKATGRASLATIGRIGFTALLSPLFSVSGLVGSVWAVVCLTIPVALELVISMMLARPHLKALMPGDGKPPAMKEIFLFNLPLSIGGYFLTTSAIFLGAFIARTPEPERILPIYYLALGLVNPVNFAATRIQTLVLAFPPGGREDRTTFKFSLIAGSVLGLLPLIFIIPGLSDFYYIELQKLTPVDLPLVRFTALSLIFLPLSTAIRAQSEGLAALKKKPVVVTAGHAAFMLSVIGCGAVAFVMGIPGYLIGPLGLTLGSLMSSVVIRLTLNRTREREVPLGQTTTTSVGQIR